jgi:hypothetical protein
MKAWSRVGVVLVMPVLCGGLVAGQNPRDNRDPLEGASRPGELPYTLANAPLNEKERAAIYKLIDSDTVHDSFTDQQRDEERQAVLGSAAGWITLADKGSKQLLVRGPISFCGASGNCSWWVFVRDHGGLRLALRANGDFLVRQTSSQGFRDVMTSWHMSAAQANLTFYTWNGTKYIETGKGSAP